MTAPPVTELTDVADLCHWRRGLAVDVSHVAYHHGEPCPFTVAAEVLAGRPDPRDAIAEWRIDISSALTSKGAVPLSLNDRMHWAAKASATARVKAVVRNAVLAAEVPRLDHVHVEMHYRPKTNRFRDIDNTVATLKAAIDALHHADNSPNAPVPYVPIVDGDDPRFVSWSPPVLHAWQRGFEPALWLVLRSADMAAVTEPVGVQLEIAGRRSCGAPAPIVPVGDPKAAGRATHHRPDVEACLCGQRHCSECGEVWPCTAETERRYAAAVGTGDPT